jgi:hypothetical protein
MTIPQARSSRGRFDSVDEFHDVAGILIPERALNIARRTREARSRKHGRLHQCSCGALY